LLSRNSSIVTEVWLRVQLVGGVDAVFTRSAICDDLDAMLTKALLAAALVTATLGAQPRERLNFNRDWRFHPGEALGAAQPGFPDADWRRLDLPHDWSIEGPYSPENASGTGYLPGGIGWYRKEFPIATGSTGRRYLVEFDGVYRDSDVWINGHHLGHRPYGYSSFAYDLTPWIRYGTKPNVLAVRVDHSHAADSRWYTGSGIYRSVWLTVTGPVHVDHWGTYLYTPEVRDSEALVSVEASVVNESAAAATVRVETTLAEGAAPIAGEAVIAPGSTHRFTLQGPLAKPRLWSLEDPHLYTAVTRVYAAGKLADEYQTPFGIRTLRFDPNRGFSLNGRPEKFQGVCIHHDLGALGAAFSEAALERRLRALKAVGVNAIRCSHNPMAPELYDLCDRLGLLVLDEAFDEWTAGKKKWIHGRNVGTPGLDGYHEAFAEWSVRDIEDMVRRDRNHPSVVMWSIGNEIDYPGDPFGHPRGHDGLKPGMLDGDALPSIARTLIAAVKRLDGTRPITQALADIDASNATGLAGLLDITGYNYLEQFYERDHAAYPERIILGTENSTSPAAWRPVAANPWVLGQFLWTGVDFLGESGPYPLRGSASGLFDLCGFPKPQAHLRAALWTDRPMVYAAVQQGRAAVEDWNWQDDSQRTLPVVVYTNCDSAELFLNGRSLGEKTVADRAQPVLHWNVRNEPGVLLAVAKRSGSEAARFALATTGKPAALQVVPDAVDPTHVEIRVADNDGRRVYRATNEIEVQVTGGELVAVDNADLRDVSPVHANRRKAYQGRILAIVRRPGGGTVSVCASAPGLKPGRASVALR
jgi:beta-galactosidase